jgi:hypothetical protein
VFVACVALAGATLVAHHSVPGQFDTSKPITLKGTVSRIEWINPHIYVHLDVKDEKETASWTLGSAPPAMLRSAGLTKEAIAGKPGEVVTIIAYPARDGTKHLGWITRITYEDGHYYLLDGR